VEAHGETAGSEIEVDSRLSYASLSASLSLSYYMKFHLILPFLETEESHDKLCVAEYMSAAYVSADVLHYSVALTEYARINTLTTLPFMTISFHHTTGTQQLRYPCARSWHDGL
jgi:hypothetical protein